MKRRSWAIVRRFGSILRLSLILLPLTACGMPQTSDTSTGVSDSGGELKVLTTFTILADMARQVGCGRVQVESITKPGAEVHGYEFTPSDLKRAQGASLVLENGLDLEQWSRRFTAQLGDVPHVVLSKGVDTLPIGSDDDRPPDGGTVKANPHAWMSPRSALTYVDNIRDAFISLDPANAQTYEACASRYAMRLRELDRELANRLAAVPSDKRLLVSCEGAFSYLARDYGLKEAWLWPVNGERQVTPQRMEKVIRTVRERRVPAVFCESTVDDRAQRRVAAETGARFAGTFYVDSLSGPEGPAASYFQLMRHNVTTLLHGLTPASGAQGGTR
jgi:manganese transport system substrate-binding protein